MALFSSFVAAIVPLLIAVDLASVVTVFLALTEGSDASQTRKVMREALVTALALGLGFVLLGAGVFRLLGIDTADFKIGGGLILLVLSLSDLVVGNRAARRKDDFVKDDFVGVVPLGTPLIVGPAVLAALTVLVGTHGHVMTIAAFAGVLAVTALVLAFAARINRLIGTGGLKALSKVVSILLAAFAVHLIRSGVLEILRSGTAG